MVHDDQLDGRGRNRRRSLKLGEHVDHFDTVRVRKDGQTVHVSVTISPIKDEAGNIIGISKIARDITERRQAELRIDDLLAQLKDTDRRKDEFLATLAPRTAQPAGAAAQRARDR